MTTSWLGGDERAPDIIGEIVGFRAWKVHLSVMHGAFLVSLNGTMWPRDTWLRAHCNGSLTRCHRHERILAVTGLSLGTDPEPVPGRGCSCGIYAARDRLHLMNQWQYNRAHGVVIGEVGLAGRFIEGEKAHRAEKARPLRLWVAHSDWRLVKPLADAYRIPVELSNVLNEGRHDGRPNA